METLLVDPSYPIQMAPCAPTLKSDVGAAAAAFRRQWPIAYYEFTIPLPFDEQETAEALLAFAVYHQGDTPFWLDGGHWGAIDNSIFIDFTDGARTQFSLPRRNIFAPSWVLEVNGSINTGWTAVESTGLVIFSSPPAAGRLCGKGRNKFKCVFSFDDRKIYEPEEIYSQIYNDGKLVAREVP
jgi:hypothetical protein